MDHSFSERFRLPEYEFDIENNRILGNALIARPQHFGYCSHADNACIQH